MSTMTLQWIVALLVVVGSASARTTDSLLRDLGKGLETVHCEGTLNAYGTQTIQGIPFTAVIAGRDSFAVTMNGPFGLTAAQLYATRDTFVFVNYMMQQVFDGKTDAPTIAQAMPFGITIKDLFALMGGQVPGDPERFVVHSVRNDSTVLFVSKQEHRTEFALVDTARGVLKQYQSKDQNGVLTVNVTFADVHIVNGQPFSYAVDVAVDDKRQSMTFRMTSVHVNDPVTSPLSVRIPSTFQRTTFR